MKYLNLLFLLSFIAYVSCNDNPTKEVTELDLKLNLNTGDKYWYENTIKQELNILNIPLEQEINIIMLWEVLPKQDGNEVLEMSFQKIKLKSKSPDKTISFDSEKSNNNDYLSKLGKLKDKQIKVILSPKGKIIAIEGLAALAQSFRSQKEIKDFFTDSVIYYSVQSAFYGLPDSVIRVQDEWKYDYVLPVNNFELTFQNTNKLNSIVQNKVAVGMQTILFTDKSNNKADISGKMYGTKMYDKVSGMLISSETEQEMSGNFVQNGAEIPINLQQKEITKCKLMER